MTVHCIFFLLNHLYSSLIDEDIVYVSRIMGIDRRWIHVVESDVEEVKRLKEIKNKDAKALFFIQQGVHETIF